MKISLIAAVSKNSVIGIDGKMPWHLPADLAYFKGLTINKTVVMGRKTYESIGRPLPNRNNVIISSHSNYLVADCQIFTSLQSAIDHIDEKEIIIIGGGMLYAQALPIATTLYLTVIDAVCNGDTFFPEINEKEWKEISREKHLADKENVHNYDFVMLQRF